MRHCAIFLKNNYNSNYRQNMLPINLDDNNYQTHKHSFFIRSELKCKPQENTA